MVRQQSGKIINIASMWAWPVRPACSRAGLYRRQGRRGQPDPRARAPVRPAGNPVNALCPGFYQTNLSRGAIDDPQVRATITAFIPMGRIAEAAEIKGPALFLASAASDYMTGQTLVTDGGCLEITGHLTPAGLGPGPGPRPGWLTVCSR